MSAIFVRPLGFTVGTNTGWTTATPVSNASLDHPGIVARSTGNTASFTVNLGSTQTIDTIALVSNLPATATLAITAGTYTGNITAAAVAPPFSTKTLSMFSAVSTSTVTISITSNAPIEIQRIIVGRRVEIDGLDAGAEHTINDQSITDVGAGYRVVDEYPSIPVWKAKASFLTDAKWRNEIVPFSAAVGQRKAFLFVPKADEPTRIQSEAVFGWFTQTPKGDAQSYDNWSMSFEVTGLAL